MDPCERKKDLKLNWKLRHFESFNSHRLHYGQLIFPPPSASADQLTRDIARYRSSLAENRNLVFQLGMPAMKSRRAFAVM